MARESSNASGNVKHTDISDLFKVGCENRKRVSLQENTGLTESHNTDTRSPKACWTASATRGSLTAPSPSPVSAVLLLVLRSLVFTPSASS